jgi:hypothetical protein
MEGMRLSRFERVQTHEKSRGLIEGGLPHLVGAPLGVVARVDNLWMFHMLQLAPILPSFGHS